MNDLTAIALSGGIDSLVAAHLLKQQGHRLVGVHFQTGYGRFDGPGGADGQAAHPLRAIAEALEIDVHFCDCRRSFRREVVEYFCRDYAAGRTPNPCLVCNAHIKFGALLDCAAALGAGRLATGHYARVVWATTPRRPRLLRGRDRAKEQSYFLAFLTPAQLAAAVFPLGSMDKNRVRQAAARAGLADLGQPESQDICFLQGKDYGDFLAHELSIVPGPGPIVDTRGKTIGRHDGLHRFTIGQRRGINCPGPEAYYVVRMENSGNRLVVGHKEDLYTSICRVSGINWIAPPPGGPLAIGCRIRYRHRAAPAVLEPVTATDARVRFQEPQKAVTPGQAAVFYLDDEVLGGGWIEADW